MRGNIFLLIAAFIWGTTFVAQSVGMDRLGPFTYGAARFFLGMIFLFILWKAVGKRRENGPDGLKEGTLAGIIMFAASATQQFGIQFTTVGRASFLTCLYIIFVPIAGIFIGRRAGAKNFIGALLALFGLYLLSIKEDFSINRGDAIVFLSAFFWTAHILFIDRFASKVEVIGMSLAQVTVTFLCNLAAALAFESWIWDDVISSWGSLSYAGILSTGIAFTLQIAGQKTADPEAAAVIMSLEAVFGALSGWLVLGQALSLREITGCAMMTAGMITTQYGKTKADDVECKNISRIKSTS